MGVASGVLGVGAMVLAVAVGADAYVRNQDLSRMVAAISAKSDATDAIAKQASAVAAQAVTKAEQAAIGPAKAGTDANQSRAIAAIAAKVDAIDAVSKKASAAAAQAAIMAEQAATGAAAAGTDADQARAIAAAAKETAVKLAAREIAFMPASAPLPAVNHPGRVDQTTLCGSAARTVQ